QKPPNYLRLRLPIFPFRYFSYFWFFGFSQMNNLLKTPIEYLKGIGPQRADLLKRELGIFVYEYLLHLFPNRYIDRTRYYKINQLQPTFNAEVQVVGKILHLKVVEQKKGLLQVATFVDDTGQME